ncbi:TonB-dependent receptor [Sphingomonas sp. BN140010]|uniref:TonB-dependent receptor n=1 Tax=Sphingomonas arvum TaxID=2992113 RepID=A0ABT3JCT3_9SPHN|nr:TonB-dependent receptor [Sphingomonas sp. BN140010]MCW3796880.1 TonB-dependent receptor [Sphingomonas sp. BN140010]
MLITLLAGAAASATGASVKETQPDTIVVTGSRLPAGAAEVKGRPGGTDLVAADQFKNKAAVSLRDALAFSPGVYAQPRFGQEVRLSIRGSGISRGYHMRGLTLLQDGIPINLADDNGDFQELDPTILDRLEVYRGANAFRFGGTTLGGAINGVTPTGRTSPGVRVRADGGSFDTVRGLASVGLAADELDGWLAVNGDRSDGDRDHAYRSGLRMNGNVGWQPSRNVQTRFYLTGNRLRQELPGALTYSTVTTRPKSGSYVGDQARDIDSLRIQNRTNLQLGGVDLEGGAFANWKSLHHPIFEVVDQDSVDRGFFGRIGWTVGNLQLLSGITARFGTVDAKRSVNLNGRRGAQTFEADQTARTIDVYGEARLGVAAGITAIAGGVYTSGKRRQEQTFPVAITGSASFDQFSPRLGLLWDASDRMQFYANVSRSHELPGFIELAQVAAFVPVKAQHAWTGEIGARGSIGKVQLDVSFYRAKVRNELLQFTVSSDIPASTFNADRTLHQGIEAGLQAPLAPWARLRATYQFNDFRFERDRLYGDNRLPVIPKHLLRTEVRFGAEAWSIAPSVEWVPQGAWADYRNTFRTSGYAMLGLIGSMAVDRRTELFADLRNLTNKKAAGDVSAVIAWSPTSAIFYPAERRAFSVGVRSRFGGGTP